MDEKALLGLALRSAARSGDPQPTGVYWVRSSRAAIAGLIGWGLGAGDGSRDQALLTVTGQFVLDRVSRPRGARSPTGTILTVVLNLDLTVTDIGCRESDLDLTGPGLVHRILMD